MKTIQIEIPQKIAISLRIPQESIRKRLTEELAVHLYKEGFLSFGKARELASLSKWQFSELLGSREVPRHYSQEDLEEDIQFSNAE